MSPKRLWKIIYRNFLLLGLVSCFILVVIYIIHDTTSRHAFTYSKEPQYDVGSGDNGKVKPCSYCKPQILQSPEQSKADSQATVKLSFTATAYCQCEKCCGKWAKKRDNGPVVGAAQTKLIPFTSVAVDSSIFPFGTIFIDEQGKHYIAADTGSGVNGNHIDIYFNNHQEALNFGVRQMVLTVVHTATEQDKIAYNK